LSLVTSAATKPKSRQQLLRDYAGSHSEAAFAELVRRHMTSFIPPRGGWLPGGDVDLGKPPG